MNLNGYTNIQWGEFAVEAHRCKGIYKYQKSPIAQEILKKITESNEAYLDSFINSLEDLEKKKIGGCEEFLGLKDIVDDSTQVVYLTHVHWSNFRGDTSKHACLDRGFWCWKHVFESPLKAIKYLWRKL